MRRHRPRLRTPLARQVRPFPPFAGRLYQEGVLDSGSLTLQLLRGRRERDLMGPTGDPLASLCRSKLSAPDWTRWSGVEDCALQSGDPNFYCEIVA